MKSLCWPALCSLALLVLTDVACAEDAAKSNEAAGTTKLELQGVEYILPFTLPSSEEIVQALPERKPDKPSKFFTHRDRKVTALKCELLGYHMGQPKDYPRVGRARMLRATFKCIVDCKLTLRSEWPVPFEHSGRDRVVVYIDREKLMPTQ